MRGISVVAFAIAASVAYAQPQTFQEGVHYRTISPVQPTNDSAKIEVVEVFNYSCPACASFQPHVESWSEDLPEHIAFLRMPVVFQPSWEPYARAYYTAEALGVLEKSHAALFDAIHTERRPLRSAEDLAGFFEQFGVQAPDYLKTASSFSVETKMRRSATLAQRYGVTGTPSVVINGKYLTGGRMAGSYERMIEVVDFLVAMEMAALPNATSVGDGQPEGADTGEN